MRTISVALVLLFAIGSLFGCASAADGERSSSPLPSGPTSLEEPLMKAERLQVPRDAVVTKVSGNCQLIRSQEVSVKVSQGLSLQDGDVLDLGTDCSLQIVAGGNAPLRLSNEMGRFFKLAIPGEAQ